jgi:hypothetical protein
MNAAPARIGAALASQTPGVGVVRRTGRALAAVVARIRALAPESWLLLLLGVLLLTFLAALIVEPGSVGRGGR